MTALPSDDAHGDIGRLVAPVERAHQRVVITRDGQPVAVVIDPDELEGLEETVALLRDPAEAAAIDEGIADVEAGREYDAETVLADLRARRHGQ